MFFADDNFPKEWDKHISFGLLKAGVRVAREPGPGVDGGGGEGGPAEGEGDGGHGELARRQG